MLKKKGKSCEGGRQKYFCDRLRCKRGQRDVSVASFLLLPLILGLQSFLLSFASIRTFWIQVIFRIIWMESGWKPKMAAISPRSSLLSVTHWSPAKKPPPWPQICQNMSSFTFLAFSLLAATSSVSGCVGMLKGESRCLHPWLAEGEPPHTTPATLFTWPW